MSRSNNGQPARNGILPNYPNFHDDFVVREFRTAQIPSLPIDRFAHLLCKPNVVFGRWRFRPRRKVARHSRLNGKAGPQRGSKQKKTALIIIAIESIKNGVPFHVGSGPLQSELFS
jgi:hypothetical protein